MSYPQMPLADDLACRNLIARYAHLADAGELAAFADLFTPDGSWTRENSPPGRTADPACPQRP